MIAHEFLTDQAILKYIDSLQHKNQYVKIVVLNRDEVPLRAIEGRATAGSVNINASSAVRRTCNLTLVTDYKKGEQDSLNILNEVTKIETLISMNKRVALEIGIENTGGRFSDYGIFWFPLGIFIISKANVSYNMQGISIALSLSDKMALLNGQSGGVFTDPITFSPVDEWDENQEAYVSKEAKFIDILESLLQQYLSTNAIQYQIEDVPSQIAAPLLWEPQGGDLTKFSSPQEVCLEADWPKIQQEWLQWTSGDNPKPTLQHLSFYHNFLTEVKCAQITTVCFNPNKILAAYTPGGDYYGSTVPDSQFLASNIIWLTEDNDGNKVEKMIQQLYTDHYSIDDELNNGGLARNTTYKFRITPQSTLSAAFLFALVQPTTEQKDFSSTVKIFCTPLQQFILPRSHPYTDKNDISGAGSILRFQSSVTDNTAKITYHTSTNSIPITQIIYQFSEVLTCSTSTNVSKKYRSYEFKTPMSETVGLLITRDTNGNLQAAPKDELTADGSNTIDEDIKILEPGEGNKLTHQDVERFITGNIEQLSTIKVVKVQARAGTNGTSGFLEEIQAGALGPLYNLPNLEKLLLPFIGAVPSPENGYSQQRPFGYMFYHEKPEHEGSLKVVGSYGNYQQYFTFWDSNLWNNRKNKSYAVEQAFVSDEHSTPTERQVICYFPKKLTTIETYNQYLTDNDNDEAQILQMTAVPYSAFENLKITNAILSESINAIAGKAFKNSSLQYITMSKNIKELRYYSFANCYSLKAMTFPVGSSLEVMRQNAFQNTPTPMIYWLGSEEDWNKVNIKSDASDGAGLTTEPVLAQAFQPREVCGKKLVDFVYPSSQKTPLAINAGDTVVTMLDKLVNTLGNYEYFFDVNGVFHFREIKNYLNEGSAFDDLTQAINEKYFTVQQKEKAVYSFDDASLITAYNNNPNYQQIKNDFVLWGQSADRYALKYHLRFMKLPASYEHVYWGIAHDTDIQNLSSVDDTKTYEYLSTITEINKNTYEQNGGTNGLEYTLLNDGTYSVSVGTAQNAEHIIIPNFYMRRPVTQVVYSGFKNHQKMQSLIIGNNVTKIGDGAFANCSQLKEITIGKGVTEIAVNAFDGCVVLERLNFNAIDCQTIGSNRTPFTNCGKSNIQKDEYGNEVIDENGNKVIKGFVVVFGNGVNSIPSYLFQMYPADEHEYNNTNQEVVAYVNTVIIPSTVTYIGAHVFCGCPSLVKVYYFGTQENWEAIYIGSDNEILAKDGVLQYAPKESDQKAIIEELGLNNSPQIEKKYYEVLKLSKAEDWRRKLYFMALAKPASKRTPFEVELIEWIPKYCNYETGELNTSWDNEQYFLDVVDTGDLILMDKIPIKSLGVDEIGVQTLVTNNEKVNCLFPSKNLKSVDKTYVTEPGTNNTVNIVYIEPEYDPYLVPYVTYENSAYEALRSELHNYLSYNENINITCMPIYHLDVNQRIRVDNDESDIHGDYIIKSISLPLSVDGMMTINAQKAVERI